MSSQFAFQPFQASTLMERSFSNVGLSKGPSLPMRNNLLSFLATAQALEIEFLPITWQTARKAMGQGGTSRITQAPANIQMSLAFKVVKDEEKIEKTEAELFQMVTNEITVLGHPSVKEHPNIAQLQALCWDVSDEKVWPVLVFEKSQFEDLYSFVTLPVEEDLDVHQRLKLCIDVGEAMIYMHSHNIIHGDIKPQNVLIFKNHDGTYTARVIDFGFSTCYADDTDLIAVAISRPWNAPEHSRRSKLWTPLEAKKLDYFSFGISCLWILFEKELSAPIPPFRKAAFWGGNESPCSLSEQSIEILQTSKADRNLPLLAQWLLDAEKGLNDDERAALKDFFTSVLDEDQDRRDMEAGKLFQNHKTGHSIAPSPLKGVESRVPDYDFKIQKSIVELYTADYRVRLYIAQCLEETLSHVIASPSTEPVENIALQVALCYELGFGVKRDKDMSMKALQKSNYNQFDGREIVGQWKQIERNENLLRSEYLPYIEDEVYYLEGKVLEQAEKQLLQEREDLEQSLGSGNYVVLLLKDKISRLLLGQGRWKEAEELQMQVVKDFEEMFGAEHQETLINMGVLASIYCRQKRWDEAEELELQIIEISEKRLGAKHPNVLSRISVLATIYSDQGRLDEAKKLKEQLLETSMEVFGAEHPNTLIRMSNLAGTYNDQGRLEEAAKLKEHALQMSKRTLGEEHPDTMIRMSNLAKTYSDQEHWEKAEPLEQQVLEMSQRILGPEHPDTLVNMVNLAETYAFTKQHKKASLLEKQILQICRKRLRVEHPSLFEQHGRLTGYVLDKVLPG